MERARGASTTPKLVCLPVGLGELHRNSFACQKAREPAYVAPNVARQGGPSPQATDIASNSRRWRRGRQRSSAARLTKHALCQHCRNGKERHVARLLIVKTNDGLSPIDLIERIFCLRRCNGEAPHSPLAHRFPSETSSAPHPATGCGALSVGGGVDGTPALLSRLFHSALQVAPKSRQVETEGIVAAVADDAGLEQALLVLGGVVAVVPHNLQAFCWKVHLFIPCNAL